MNDTPAFPPSNSRSDNDALSPFTAAPPVDAPDVIRDAKDLRGIFPNDQPDPTTGDKEPDFPAERTIGIIGHLKKTTKSRRSGWLYMKIPASGSVPGSSEHPESSIPSGKGPVSDVRAYFAEELTDRGLDANAAPVVRSPEVAVDGSREWAIWGGKGEPDRDAFEKVEVSSVAARAEALKAELDANERAGRFAEAVKNKKTNHDRFLTDRKLPGRPLELDPNGGPGPFAGLLPKEKNVTYGRLGENNEEPAFNVQPSHDVTFGEDGPGGRCLDCHEDLTNAEAAAAGQEEAVRFTEAVKKWNESPAAKELAEFQAGSTPPQETYRPDENPVTRPGTERWAYTSKQPLDAASVRQRFGRPGARVVWDPSPEAPNSVAAIWLGEGPPKTVPFPLKDGGSREHAEALRDVALRDAALRPSLAVQPADYAPGSGVADYAKYLFGVEKAIERRRPATKAELDAVANQTPMTLKVKLGEAEFEANGSGEFVGLAFTTFLDVSTKLFMAALHENHGPINLGRAAKQ